MKKIFAVLTAVTAAAVLAARLNAGGMETASAASGLAFGDIDLSSARLDAPVLEPAAATAEAGFAADADLWNAYLSGNFGGAKASPRPVFADKGVSDGSRVLERVALESILDANLNTRLTFKTSNNTVHVSGALARNCPDGGTSCSENDRYFMLFHTDKGQTVFVKGKEIANALLMSGEKEISFDGDGEKYLVKLFVKLSSPNQSRLKVESQGRMVLDISLEQLSAALVEKGTRLSVGSRHNLFYNTEVLQDGKGNGRFGKGRVLTFSPVGPQPNQYISEALITAAGVMLNSVEPQFGFRMANGVLEIYQL